MSQQDDFNIQITADISQLLASMQAATAQTQAAAQQISASLSKSGDGMDQAAAKVAADTRSMSDSLKSLDKQVAALADRFKMLAGGGGIGGLLGALGLGAIGGTVTKMITDFEAMGEKLEYLKNQLGVSANEARAWQVAAKQSHVDTDEFSGAMRRLGMEVARGAPVLTQLGIATRDAGGHARSMSAIFEDTISKLSSFAASSDRAAIAQKLLGMSQVDLIGKGQQLVQSFEAQRQKIEESGKSYQDLINQGRALYQIQVQIEGQWKQMVASSGPALIALLAAIASAVKVLTAAFHTAALVVAAFIEGVTNAVSTTWDVVQKLTHLDFAGAYTSITTGAKNTRDTLDLVGKQIDQDWSGAFKNIKDNWDTVVKAMRGQLPGPPETGGVPAPSAESILGKGGKGGGGKGKTEDFSGMDAELTKLNDKYQQMKATFAEVAKDIQQDHSAAFQEMAAKTVEDFDLMRSAYMEYKVALESHDKALARQFSADWQVAFQKFEQDSRKALEQFKKDQEEMDREAKKVATSFGQEFGSSLTGLITGTTTLAQAWTSLLQKMLEELITYAIQMAIYWALTGGKMKDSTTDSFGGMLGALVNYITQSLGLHASQAAAKKVIDLGQIEDDAAVGAAGAAASQASTPFIGPALAVAAATAMDAFIMGFASAAGGFDIPAGMSPLTQLHPREMVLPADLAEGVRGMVRGGGATGGTGGGGGGNNYETHIHAIDAQSVQRLFTQNGRHIANVVARQVRAGQYKFT
jgi:hypothetical protein